MPFQSLILIGQVVPKLWPFIYQTTDMTGCYDVTIDVTILLFCYFLFFARTATHVRARTSVIKCGTSHRHDTVGTVRRTFCVQGAVKGCLRCLLRVRGEVRGCVDFGSWTWTCPHRMWTNEKKARMGEIEKAMSCKEIGAQSWSSSLS